MSIIVDTLFGIITAIAIGSFITGAISFVLLMLNSPLVSGEAPMRRFADEVLNKKGRSAKKWCIISAIAFQISILAAIVAAIAFGDN